MEFTRLQIPDVVLIQPCLVEDERGYFFEAWEKRNFAAAGIAAEFVQENCSHSLRGALRGLHYQLRRPQGKLFRVTSGAVFDVAVDLRRSSPTFGQWVGAELSQTNGHMLWIPPGFAHGFFVLSETADCVYKCTDYYDPQSERSVLWSDAQLGIRWPFDAGFSPTLSARDAAGVAFSEAECFP